MTLYYEGKIPQGIFRPISEAYEGTLKRDTSSSGKPATCTALLDQIAQKGVGCLPKKLETTKPDLDLKVISFF